MLGGVFARRIDTRGYVDVLQTHIVGLALIDAEQLDRFRLPPQPVTIAGEIEIIP